MFFKKGDRVKVTAKGKNTKQLTGIILKEYKSFYLIDFKAYKSCLNKTDLETKVEFC